MFRASEEVAAWAACSGRAPAKSTETVAVLGVRDHVGTRTSAFSAEPFLVGCSGFLIPAAGSAQIVGSGRVQPQRYREP